ncbi:hypothetical protein GCM10009541_33130 [Micromonospora gifhornensis]|uniref:Uncharacterized protein n=1 Tax=Micromonospora gifhornensis TaxID=84594 RepID=A0ABQ4IA50_9ACTN|nr:hypothetical protein Vgi01_14780 [Micromonospora gifhornensis]
MARDLEILVSIRRAVGTGGGRAGAAPPGGCPLLSDAVLDCPGPLRGGAVASATVAVVSWDTLLEERTDKTARIMRSGRLSGLTGGQESATSL